MQMQEGSELMKRVESGKYLQGIFIASSSTSSNSLMCSTTEPSVKAQSHVARDT